MAFTLIDTKHQKPVRVKLKPDTKKSDRKMWRT
ncbi:hypothetical protein [Pelotomaculum schinkii]